MIITNKKLMRTYSAPGPCEACGQWFEQRECHHVWGRGSSGAQRLDLPITLMGLCFWCHQKCPGILTRTHCLMIVARREHCSPEDIIAVVYFLRRLHKNTTARAVRLAFTAGNLTESGQALAWLMLDGYLLEEAG